MKIVILAPALAELDEAAIYYSERASPRIAQAFLDDFEHARKRLATYPEIGTHFPRAIASCPCGISHIPSSSASRPWPPSSTPLPNSAAGRGTGGGASRQLTRVLSEIHRPVERCRQR